MCWSLWRTDRSRHHHHLLHRRNNSNNSKLLPHHRLQPPSDPYVMFMTLSHFVHSNTNTKQVQTSTEPTIVPVKGIQKAMLQSMTQSLTIPHFGYCDEIEMTKAMEFRRQLNNSPETKVTMMPILLKAASLALKSYPVLNSSLSECQTQLVQHASHNMGFAMDTPRGLLVRGVRAWCLSAKRENFLIFLFHRSL